MILESTQLLRGVLNEKGFAAPYRSTHARHLCALWVGELYDSFRWLVTLRLALNKAYRWVFEKPAFATWTEREAQDRFVPETSRTVLIS